MMTYRQEIYYIRGKREMMSSRSYSTREMFYLEGWKKLERSPSGSEEEGIWFSCLFNLWRKSEYNQRGNPHFCYSHASRRYRIEYFAKDTCKIVRFLSFPRLSASAIRHVHSSRVIASWCRRHILRSGQPTSFGMFTR